MRRIPAHATLQTHSESKKCSVYRCRLFSKDFYVAYIGAPLQQLKKEKHSGICSGHRCVLVYPHFPPLTANLWGSSFPVGTGSGKEGKAVKKQTWWWCHSRKRKTELWQGKQSKSVSRHEAGLSAWCVCTCACWYCLSKTQYYNMGFTWPHNRLAPNRHERNDTQATTQGLCCSGWRATLNRWISVHCAP